MYCSDALIITDNLGHIIHVNRGWTILTGYELFEVELKTCKFLQGKLTDNKKMLQLDNMIKNNQIAETSVYNYCRNGEVIFVKIIVIPIKGGYMNSG
jgi:two-component system CheB/CheR fusion protein